MAGRSTAQRSRQSPEESETEILRAAEEALCEKPFGKLTVGSIMARTRLGRSSFYVHFQDVHDLVARLLQRLETQLWAASEPWFDEEADRRAAIVVSVSGVVGVWAEHGPVLAAIAQASMTDERIRGLWRDGVVERFVDVIDGHLATDNASAASSADRAARRRLAAALLLMNERYLIDTLGSQPGDDPTEVADTLTTVWSRAFYPDTSG